MQVIEPVLQVLFSVPEWYDYCYFLKCYTVLRSKTTSCFDFWVYSRHFFQVHRLGKLHMQCTNWKRCTAQSELAHTIYFSEHTSFTHICFVFLKQVWIQTKSQWYTQIPPVPKASTHHHSGQTCKCCSLLVSDPNQVTDAKRVLKILLSAWQTNSCAPTGTCATKPDQRRALPSALSPTSHSMRVEHFKNSPALLPT